MMKRMPLGKWNVHGRSMLIESLRPTFLPAHGLRAARLSNAMLQSVLAKHRSTKGHAMPQLECAAKLSDEMSAQEPEGSPGTSHHVCPATGCCHAPGTAGASRFRQLSAISQGNPVTHLGWEAKVLQVGGMAGLSLKTSRRKFCCAVSILKTR